MVKISSRPESGSVIYAMAYLSRPDSESVIYAMAYCLVGAKPLTQPMLIYFPMDQKAT